jgi:hypothetical protein
MGTTAAVRIVALSLALIATEAAGQNSYTFDVAAYETFLRAHNDIPSSELLAMYPAGRFARSVPGSTVEPRMLSLINAKYALTGGEKALLGENGFVVTERIPPGSFGQAYLDIYRADLPLYISTDAILHALHMSYDELLKQTEEEYLVPKLKMALSSLAGTLSWLEQKYAGHPAMKPSLQDLDLYLAVAQRLLMGTGPAPYFPENVAAIADVLAKINASYVGKCAPLFGDVIRVVDYSQFTIRGHYTQSVDLGRYFQSMMWLSRMEFYLSPPDDSWDEYTKPQIQRQAVAAVLFSEASGLAGTDSVFAEFDRLLGFFVGEPDNVTQAHLRELCTDLWLRNAAALLDTVAYNAFHDTLMTKSWAYQRILSQILKGHMFTPGSVQPAAAFLPLGQRFIIDSFVSSKVVFDKIEFQGEKVWRELPSPLDVMFALGNDAAAQLLVGELDRYHYADNLAALRYLIDSYEPAYWQTNFFNGWLGALRALDPPQDRSGLPSFMQTASWWQEKLNTQLSSWAELRHDNILYAKQSYTASGACAYPCGYVEPFPLFYGRVDSLMRKAKSFFLSGPEQLQYVADFFGESASVCSTLTVIADKELAGVALSTQDTTFLGDWIIRFRVGCGARTGGWYSTMFFNRESELHENLIVADVHTCPTNPAGAYIGWVLHVGTGPVDMAVVVADVPGFGSTAFVGPVMSYYQRVTTQFKRLTDEEWASAYAVAPSFRPSWMNSFLADKSGSLRAAGDMLLTDVPLPRGGGVLPTEVVLAHNYPNPFNPTTQIHFGLPVQSYVTLGIYDVLGRQVAELVNRTCEAGSHAVTWDGRNSGGGSAATGVYFARFVVRDAQGAVAFTKTNRMLLVK